PVEKEQSTDAETEQIEQTDPVVPLGGAVDFLPIQQSLERKKIPVTSILTDVNKRLMNQLVHLYHLQSFELEKAVEWALTEENVLDIEKLKQACHDVFKMKQNNVPTRLTSKQESDAEKDASSKQP